MKPSERITKIVRELIKDEVLTEDNHRVAQFGIQGILDYLDEEYEKEVKYDQPQ